MRLKHGVVFDDLYTLTGLEQIDEHWLRFLSAANDDVYQALNLIRSGQKVVQGLEESKFIIQLSMLLQEFLADLFSIEAEVSEQIKSYGNLAELYHFKRNFIQRTVLRQPKWTPEQLEVARSQLGVSHVADELLFMSLVKKAQERGDEELIAAASVYAAWAVTSEEGRRAHEHGTLFKAPRKLNYASLLRHVVHLDGVWNAAEIESREGFNHTDAGVSAQYAADQAGYCIKCHNQQKDSCSHGLKQKDAESFERNALGINLSGCPLEEKISEMNELVAHGAIIAAFAVVIIDNPMVAATGHRICNDCMKSCIYQKQEPVNIPAIESKVLKEVLSLPWGFELYSLLTKWNPLKWAEYLPRAENGRKVLVVGQGPAGFTAAHYLLQMGYAVVAIDGLKIEPNRFAELKPIRDVFTEMCVELGERIPSGFGGVAEYGITVRWDKNYLTLIRTLLERRQSYKLLGGVRFGSNLDYQDAHQLGFDHIVLAMGAGKPNLPEEVPNIMARGCKMASEFLMALQSAGASGISSTANLQIRMPVVVIGGGLTAVDAATEAMAYYPVQVEKLLRQYEAVGEGVLAVLAPDERLAANEFLEHARKLRVLHGRERVEFLRRIGGVKVLYRKAITEAPSYRLNHEEVEMALREGIDFCENIVPQEALLDEFGCAKALVHGGGVIEARTILIAAGTQPNTVIAREDDVHFELNGRYFRALNAAGDMVPQAGMAKPSEVFVITKAGGDGPSVSFLGDLHPSFAGNVVKAIASAKRGVPVIDEEIMRHHAISAESNALFIAKVSGALEATVEGVQELAPGIVEVVIKSPLAAKRFKPGQFYRLQNYHAYAGLEATKEGFMVGLMEPLAMTGAWVDVSMGLIATIVLEMGGSSNFCRNLKQGEPVVLMGPTGEATEIRPLAKLAAVRQVQEVHGATQQLPAGVEFGQRSIVSGETVILIGGGLGNAVLFSIGAALRVAGTKVIYFAGYKKPADRFKIREIEKASDIIIWCCDQDLLPLSRETDYSFQGNIVECMERYAAHDASGDNILQQAERIIVIGSDGMMRAVAYAVRHGLKSYFMEDVKIIGSINSPMQCMMKEICAQCLQKHVFKVDGVMKERYVYSCVNQDQDLDLVDFEHLNARLKQNAVQEKCMRSYFMHLEQTGG